MSLFPDIIKIMVSEESTGKPIANIAARIKLFANKKNDYSFVLPLSNVRGCILVTKDWLKEEIKKEQNFFIMDYSSGLDDCKPYIEVSVLDTKALSNVVNAMFLYQESLGISDNEIEKYKKAENSRFTSWSASIELKGIEQIITIPLASKA